MDNKDEKLGRNSPCSCGSGKKYKQCCWKKEHTGPNLKLRTSLIQNKMNHMHKSMGKTLEAIAGMGNRIAQLRKEEEIKASQTEEKVSTPAEQENPPKE